MANTFTSNYNFVKSEIGGDNQSWGANLHTTLDLADVAIGKLLEDQIISGITSTAIDLEAGSGTGIISTSANLKYFESIVVGDKIRISGSSEAANGTAAAPVIHTVSAKTSADSITVSTQFVDDDSSTITVAKVLEPVHINSGPIVCAPLTNLSGTLPATRISGGVGVPGTDETVALVANGDVTLGSNASTDILSITAKITGDLTPTANGSYDLGSDLLEWMNLWIEGTANIDSLVANTAAISAGTISGITSLSVSGTSITITGASGDYSNFSVGSNGAGKRTVSTSAAADGDNGDIHYEY